jgi:hypothetical protein
MGVAHENVSDAFSATEFLLHQVHTQATQPGSTVKDQKVLSAPHLETGGVSTGSTSDGEGQACDKCVQRVGILEVYSFFRS